MQSGIDPIVQQVFVNRGGGIDRQAATPPPVSRMRESPGFARRGGGGINPSLNDALSPPFIKRSFRRLQVAARRLMEFLGDVVEEAVRANKFTGGSVSFSPLTGKLIPPEKEENQPPQ